MASFLDDLDAMLWSAAYVLLILGIAELARRGSVPRPITRKIVHIGIGTWVGPTYLLYDHQLWAVVPPLAFVLVNALSYRYGFIKSVESEKDLRHLMYPVEGQERNIGSLLYPMSVAAALFLFWEPHLRPVGLAAILVMAWGDAAAALVGRRYGRHIYRIAGHPRSLEGSLAMFGASVVGVLVAFAVLSDLPPGIWWAAGLTALGATVLEGVSRWGLDNVLVPGSAALVLLATGVAG